MLAAGMTVVEREFAAQARADRMESEPAVDEAR
jgi:hypothetical protein